jgi:two-component system nitrogen regulation response regulator NtrX
LVVDDDNEWRAVLADVLAEEGFAVATAGDGRAALQSVREAMPELVMTDIDMPLMDGCELLARVRKLARGLPVVVMTGGQNVDDATSSHAFRVIRKPVTTDVVLATVREALSCPRRGREGRLWTIARAAANVVRQRAHAAIARTTRRLPSTRVPVESRASDSAARRGRGRIAAGASLGAAAAVALVIVTIRAALA